MVAVKQAVIVAGCESYRTADFLAAASLLRLDTIVATDAPAPIEDALGHLEIDLDDPQRAAARIATAFPDAAAVVAVDDGGVQTAALAAAALRLPHNQPEAVAATRHKLQMRRLLDAADVAQPRFAEANAGEVPDVAVRLGLPVVVKPIGLSASRGVIRVDTVADARRTESRIRDILVAADRDPDEALLVEEYVPGAELAIEGLLVDGDLEVLAVIDKPDPLEGPFFEETLFVTPSRLPAHVQDAAIAAAADAARVIAPHVGPVHAEIRIPPEGPVQLIEIAARSIGGLCGRSLGFGLLDESLEVMVLRNALGVSGGDPTASRPASGVLMLPIPASGTLTDVENVPQVEEIAGIEEVTMTVVTGREVQALPEGDRYLGFVMASGATPDAVEGTLRQALATLTVTIDGEVIPIR
jgi:hypothetical protein